MFNISDLSVALWPTEQSYTFPFKDASPEPIGPNPLDMLPRQNWVEKLALLLLALNL